MSLCKHCISGVRHEGTPEGKVEILGGVETYIAIPTIEYPKDKALLFLPDVFGYQLVNAKLLADDFAKNGFQTYIPDYLNGDPIPPDAMSGEKPFDLNAWFANHSPNTIRPPLDAVISVLKEKGITTFGAVGFCLGGRYVFDLAFDGVIKVGATSHPSLLQVEDLEKFSKTNVPLLINSCEVDSQYPEEKQKKGDEIFANYTPGYKRTYWPGCVHGFSVRGDVSKPEVKAGREGAFKATVEWLIQYL